MRRPIEPQDWVAHAAYENGNYLNYCTQCYREFVAHKNCAICKICADGTEKLGTYTEVLGDLLQNLADMQNGSPLPKLDKDHSELMARIRRALA